MYKTVIINVKKTWYWKKINDIHSSRCANKILAL